MLWYYNNRFQFHACSIPKLSVLPFYISHSLSMVILFVYMIFMLSLNEMICIVRLSLTVRTPFFFFACIKYKIGFCYHIWRCAHITCVIYVTIFIIFMKLNIHVRFDYNSFFVANINLFVLTIWLHTIWRVDIGIKYLYYFLLA